MTLNVSTTSMATARRTGPEGIACWRERETTTPENAPTLIKPAWPRLSSPEMPTTRFRAMAMVT